MQQIPAIKRAKELGYYTITCDYLPDNPGHRFADEYHDVSTTDMEGVLELAKKLDIDGIVAYASDPAAPTAAYVLEKLGKPTSPFNSVNILTHKDLFREFLHEHGFNAPKSAGFSTFEEVSAIIDDFSFPLMIKPVDSSGSKGVIKLFSKDGLKDAVDEALSYSRSKHLIIEEFIEKKGYQISGDGFSVDGKLVFTSYGNELYSGKGLRDYVALGEFWPSEFPEEVLAKVDSELQRLITELGMKTSAYNIEVIIDKNDDVYILELGPRNGGSYIPQLIEYATGIDMVDATLKAAVGDELGLLERRPTVGFWSNYMILSRETGRFDRIEFDPDFEKKNLVDVYCTARKGDEVHAYKNTSHSLGTLIFKAESGEELRNIIAHIDEMYRIVVD